MKTRDAVKNRQAAGGVMYSGQSAGDDLFDDAEERPAKVAIYSTQSLSPTSTGIQVTGNVTEAEWLEVAENVAQGGNAINWLLGDLCIIASDKRYGALTDFAKKHQLDQRRIEDLVYVCRNVEYTVRTVGLSFTHHRLVVPFFDEDNVQESRATQKQLLTYAAVNGYSVEEFRAYINALPKTVDASGQVAIVKASSVDEPPSPPVIPFWQRPIDRMEKDILKRWNTADNEQKQEALRRLKALIKTLEKMK